MLRRSSLAAIIILLILAGAFAGCAGQAQKQPASTNEAGQVLLASTIGPVDAGIISLLEKAFEEKTGIRVRHVGAGTAAALKLGESGTFDLVIVHARALEEKFVADGFGTERIDMMYNDFVIVGPKADLAQIRGLKTSAEALKRLMDNKGTFISRGDRSGTHVKEMELWQAAGLDPQGDWYEIYDKGSEGNSRTLLYTNERGAYTMIDRATYLMLKDKIDLEVLVEKDESLLNYITIIPVNPDKFKNVNHEQAMEFIRFCTSAEGQIIIRDFGRDEYGEPLFFPNLPEGLALAKQ